MHVLLCHQPTYMPPPPTIVHVHPNTPTIIHVHPTQYPTSIPGTSYEPPTVLFCPIMTPNHFIFSRGGGGGVGGDIGLWTCRMADTLVVLGHVAAESWYNTQVVQNITLILVFRIANHFRSPYSNTQPFTSYLLWKGSDSCRRID